MSRILPLILLCLAAACGREDHLGKPPSFNPPVQGTEYNAMMSPGLPMQEEVAAAVPGARARRVPHALHKTQKMSSSSKKRKLSVAVGDKVDVSPAVILAGIVAVIVLLSILAIAL